MLLVLAIQVKAAARPTAGPRCRAARARTRFRLSTYSSPRNTTRACPEYEFNGKLLMSLLQPFALYSLLVAIHDAFEVTNLFFSQDLLNTQYEALI